MSTRAMVARVDDDSFAQIVTDGSGVIAVEFGADWCPPCRVMEPVVEAAAVELAGQMRFLAMDADANPRTLARYGVRGLPTMVVFRNGEEIGRTVGAQSLAALRVRLADLGIPAR